MTSPSEKPLQLTVMTVECMNVENGILELLLNVQNNGTAQSQIRLRLDMENAYDLRSRLSGGMVSASNQLRPCGKVSHSANSAGPSGD
jgi:hypothetical protein